MVPRQPHQHGQRTHGTNTIHVRNTGVQTSLQYNTSNSTT